MPYTAEISRVNPSCFLFLIDQSGSMADPFAGAGKTKADGVADAINRLLDNLADKCTKSEGIRDYYDVGVIGYGSTVGPAFGGSLAGQNLAPISQVIAASARLEERAKKESDGAGGLVDRIVKFPVWLESVASGGTPMTQALGMANQVLSEWVSRHPDAYPPIAINITDGQTTDGDPTANAQTLTSLATRDGNALLFNCHISSHACAPVVFPGDEAGLPDDYARLLFRMSSVLPDKVRLEARKEHAGVSDHARGFAFNADLVELIRFLDIGTRPSNLR